MAKQVENRVVEMEFKNKDFEKAVSVTMKSLEELNKKIDDLNKVNTEGFDKLTKAADGVSFQNLFDNIDRLQDRLTTLGGKFVSRIQDEIVNIGINAFSSAANGINKAYDTVTSTIVNKGKTRAQNLAQAKFQLEALGVEWKNVYDDMDYAVSGTAYGIDEAARAASQFAASNVALGKDMKAALRGISGVAAMTGRSYTEISQIFTTVAGTGRAMNGELNRIAERGLNAKKAIADYINKVDYFGNGLKVTQEQIFDFAKDGEISFDLFSKAMDDAFGEHATKANDLFTGALDNTKAALGRIGEKFATPIYEDLRQILVALIPVINDFKNSIDPVVDSVTDLTGAIRELIVEGLQKIHGAFDKEDPFNFELFGKEIDSKGMLADTLEYISDLIKGIENGFFPESILNILWNVVGVIKAIKGGIEDVFGQLTGKDITFFLIRLHVLTEDLMLSEDVLADIRSVIGGIAAVVHMVFKTVSALWEAGIKPMLIGISPLFADILDGAASLGEVLKRIDEKYDPFPKMYKFFNTLRKNLSPFTAEMGKLFDSFKKFISELTGVHDAESFFNQLNKLASDLHIADIFYAIAGAIAFAFDQLTSFTQELNNNTGFKEYMKGLVEQNAVLGWIKEKFDALKQTLNDLFSRKITLSQALGLDKLKEQFAFLTPIINQFKEHYKSIFEAYEGEAGKEGLPFIQRLSESLKKAIKELKWEDIYGLIGAAFFAYAEKKKVDIQSYLARTFGSFVDTFQKLADGINVALVKMSKETKADKILKIAGAVALLAASMVMIGSIEPNKIEQAIKYITLLMIMLGVLVVVIGKAMSTTEHFEDKFDLEKKGILNKNRKKTTGGIFGKKSIIELITDKVKESFEYHEQKVEKTIKDLTAVPGVILAIGGAIFLVISALSKLAKTMKGMDAEEYMALWFIFATAIGGIGLLIGLLLTFVADSQKNGNELNADTINVLSKMFLFLAVAIKLIIGAISSLAIVTKFAGWNNVLIAFGIVTLAVVGLYAIAEQMIQLASKHHGGYKNLLSLGAMFIMMAAAINMMIIPIAALSALMAIPGVGLYGVAESTAIIIVIMGFMALLAIEFGKMLKDIEIAGVLSGAASMVIMAAAITMMAIPIAAITGLAAVNPEALGAALVVIGIMTAVMAAIIALFAYMGQSGLGAAGMVAGALAMTIIASGIQKMSLAIAGLTALESKFPGGVAEFFKDLAEGLAMMCSVKVQAGLWLTSAALLVLGGGMIMFGAGALALGLGAKAAAEAVLFFVSALFLLQGIDLEQLGYNLEHGGAAFIHGFVQAMYGGLPDIVKGFTMWIAAGCDALVSSTAMLAEATIKLLSDVIIAIDNHSEELGFSLGHAVANIILFACAGIFAGGFDFIGMALGLEKGEGMTTLLKKRLLGKGDNISEAEAKEMTLNVGKGLGKALFENMFDGYMITSKDSSYLERLKAHFTNRIKEWIDGINIAGLISDAVTGRLASGISTRLGGKLFSTIFGGRSSADKQEIKEAMEPSADDAVEAMSEEMQTEENKDKLQQATGNLLANGISQENIDKFTDLMSQAGGDGADATIDGLMNSFDMKNLNDPSGVTYDIGEMLNEGMAQGMLDNTDILEKAADKVSAATNNRLKKNQGIASPSKLWMTFGRYMDEGLAIGLTDSNASEKAVDSKTSGINSLIGSLLNFASDPANKGSLDSIKNTIASLAEVASSDMDFTPTITPIMDMSNVNSGFASLNSMFSRDRSIALAGEVSDLNAANKMLSVQIQNENRSGTNDTISSLGTKLDRLGEAIMNRQIVLDSGELVGGLVNPMDRSLGVRAIRAQRGG